MRTLEDDDETDVRYVQANCEQVHLLTGLELEQVKNPEQVYHELLARAKPSRATPLVVTFEGSSPSSSSLLAGGGARRAGRSGELLELSLVDEEHAGEGELDAATRLPPLPSLTLLGGAAKLGHAGSSSLRQAYLSSGVQGAFRCKCPRKSIDEQRLLYVGRCSWMRPGAGADEVDAMVLDHRRSGGPPPGRLWARRGQREGSDAARSQETTAPVSVPSQADQLEVFGRLTRNSLARKLRIRRRAKAKRHEQALQAATAAAAERGRDHINEVHGRDGAAIIGNTHAVPDSRLLYKLEALLREVNTDLAGNLSMAAEESARRLGQILQSRPNEWRKRQNGSHRQSVQSNYGSRQEDRVAAPLPLPIVMIRAPLAKSGPSGATTRRASSPDDLAPPSDGGQRLASAAQVEASGGGRSVYGGPFAGSSWWSLVFGPESSSRRSSKGSSMSPQMSQDSGIEADKTLPPVVRQLTWDAQFGLLEEHVRLRASAPLQALVAHSIELFSQLINDSPLFKLIYNNSSGGRHISHTDDDDDEHRREQDEGEEDEEADEEDARLFSSQELKLYACVECQNLRSSIRFKWMAQCLELAFGAAETLPLAADVGDGGRGTSNEGAKRRAAFFAAGGVFRDQHRRRQRQQGQWLPPLELAEREEREEQKYFDLLARLMGQLLREHFLVPALERWVRLIEEHQFRGESCRRRRRHREQPAAASTRPPPRARMRVQLELLEEEETDESSGATSRRLAPSRPDEELKRTLGFVVDELASVCMNLPRLETQIESALAAAGGGGGPVSGSPQTRGPARTAPETMAPTAKSICALPSNDDLLAKTKRRLDVLIDDSRPLEWDGGWQLLFATGEGPPPPPYCRPHGTDTDASDQRQLEASGRTGSKTDDRETTPELGAVTPTTSRRRKMTLDDDDDDDDSVSVERRPSGARANIDKCVAFGAAHIGPSQMTPSAGSGDGADQGRGSSTRDNYWTHAGYLLAIKLVNRFRLGVGHDGDDEHSDLASLARELGVQATAQDGDDDNRHYWHRQWGSEPRGQHASNGGGDGRLEQLSASCRQIHLLDLLEAKLECELKRYFDFGFVVLDCRPIRETLTKCLNKERLLLTRLNLDDQLKLMERLRLQFDEIELNLDLESAVEDYLSERWQAKQSQQPSPVQQVLLADNDDDDDTTNLVNYNMPDDDDLLTGVQEPSTRPGGDSSTAVDASGDCRHNDLEDKTAAIIGRGHEQQQQRLDTRTRDDGIDGDGVNDDDDDDDKNANEDEDEDEFVAALTSDNTNNSAAARQLFALRGVGSGRPPAAEMSGGGAEGERRGVAPLVECRLLLARYRYFSQLVQKELGPLVDDIRVAFEGLVFLSEFVSDDHMQEELSSLYSDLITELAARSQGFAQMLGDSLTRLNLARQRLAQNNQLRSRVLTKLVLEFHQLVGAIGQRRLSLAAAAQRLLDNGTAATAAAGSQQQPASEVANAADDRGLDIRQLDAIQEASSWAQKLEMRCDFLVRQNDLLAKESRLLAGAKLDLSDRMPAPERAEGKGDSIDVDGNGDNADESEGRNATTKSRAIILEQWRPLVGWLAKLWRLAEEYETQQVKWLNSDIKRIDFAQMESVFNEFSRRLAELRAAQLTSGLKSAGDSGDGLSSVLSVNDITGHQEQYLRTLEHNLEELEQRFKLFATKRLPIFEFLTNRHLTETHWIKLGELLNNGGGEDTGDGSQGAAISERTMPMMTTTAPPPQPQWPGQTMCTTLAQFLELNIDQYVSQLEQMSKQASVEHELTMFLLVEAANATARAGASNDGPPMQMRRGRPPGQQQGANKQLSSRSVNVSAWLENWTDGELVLAASRFIETKLAAAASDGDNESPAAQSASAAECRWLAKRLVTSHSLVRRYLRLSYTLNLDCSTTHDSPSPSPSLAVGGEAEVDDDDDDAHDNNTGAAQRQIPESKGRHHSRRHRRRLTLRSCKWLASPELVRASLFVELLRLFTQDWLNSRNKLAARACRLTAQIDSIELHLSEMGQLVETVRRLQGHELKEASLEAEHMLRRLERDTMRLELEREVLATKEALALERQREALRQRDDCIRQLTERAIPAIRAATRALDCLDERSVRTLRSISRPHPPEPVRLVIEAVCLLRAASCCNEPAAAPTAQTTKVKVAGADGGRGAARRAGHHRQPLLSPPPTTPLEPERHFDALGGKMVDDYWPTASRMLNGTHSCQFIGDLRRVGKGNSIPAAVMRLIRRKYLSSSRFDLHHLERVSRECWLLAKWLIAVDVFDRVISVVRPNYKCYTDSERALAALLGEVSERRRQIDYIGRELQQMEDSFQLKLGHKVSLGESLNECRGQLKQVASTREELLELKEACSRELSRLARKSRRLADGCLMRAARVVYLEAMRHEERQPMAGLLLLAQAQAAQGRRQQQQ